MAGQTIALTLLALEPLRTGDRGVLTARGVVKSEPGAVAVPPPVMTVVAIEDVAAMKWGRFQEVGG
jgi:hypothetical protein